jgi:hypothetical protein
MTALALSARFRNALSQLNFFYSYRSFFANIFSEGLYVSSLSPSFIGIVCYSFAATECVHFGSSKCFLIYS